MLTRPGGTTDSVALPFTDPELAVTVTSPPETALAKPPALMVATAGSEIVQETEFVIVAVDPSEYFPVAANCLLWPIRIDALLGITVIEANIAAVTCRVALP